MKVIPLLAKVSRGCVEVRGQGHTSSLHASVAIVVSVRSGFADWFDFLKVNDK